MLDRLRKLATDGTPGGRKQLLGAVTDLYLIDNSPSRTAKNLYSEIADYSLDQMHTGDRASYAERVAAEPNLPADVAKKLASDDDITVAKVVLKRSPVLSDEDLTAIAAARSQLHLAAIAERTTLSGAVTKVLAERGDEAVLRTVSANPGAQFSDEGLFRLVERGGADPHVSQNLARRVEKMTPEQASRVRQIAKPAAPKGPLPAAGGREGAPPGPRPPERRVDVKVLIGDIREKKRELGHVVKMLAEQDRAFDLAQVISSFSDTPNAQVLRSLLDPDAATIATACRAVNLPPEAFRAILDLRVTRLNCPPKQVERDVQAYAELVPAQS